jgi:Flp pilus assembly protein TadD
MKLLLVICLLIIVPCTAYNQSGNTVPKKINTPKTYAVIVGISKYENQAIPQLEFADRDAIVFSNYLKSPSGGSVPEENIRLMLNKDATFGAVTNSLYWLLSTCKKDDLVYFYFSGHGDLETVLAAKPGYLLPYNSPATNYSTNAVGISFVNQVANTLSAIDTVKVVLITDACHSGKLAGKSVGADLVGKQLRFTRDKEIRITSCDENQLSSEDVAWGGGRGVFSYYLVKGLEGQADLQKDGVITVEEVSRYIDSCFKSDKLLAGKDKKQTPVFNGQGTFQLAKVSKMVMASQSQQAESNNEVNAIVNLKPIAEQPLTYVFRIFQSYKPEEFIDFAKLDRLPSNKIASEFLTLFLDSLQRKMYADAQQQQQQQAPQQQFQQQPQQEENNTEQVDFGKVMNLRASLVDNKDALTAFNDRLAALLSDRGQEVINLYLEGDVAELEKRRYYNLKSSSYDNYSPMFSVAAKLISPDNYLYRTLKVKQYYFSGVAERLKMPLVMDTKPLIEKALTEQKKALALEENVAYIQNELGILYHIKKDYATAEKYFLRATQISPAWAIPWSNLIGLYADTKSYEKGLTSFNKSMELQPGFQGNFMNGGILQERMGNLLFAEEDYRRSIVINDRHYLPFERLGNIYMLTTQYALADSFFNEAEKRKKGFHFSPFTPVPLAVAEQLGATGPVYCNVEESKIKTGDVMSLFVCGYSQYKSAEPELSERIFRKLLVWDKNNPLGYHYLGKLYYDQRKWMEAEAMFRLAKAVHLDSASFEKFCDSVGKLAPADRDCIPKVFKKAYYKEIEDYYFLGSVYETWNHFAEAENEFRAITEIDSGMGGFYKLWQLLERIGRYADAENVIKEYHYIDYEQGDDELAAFYTRMCERFPQSLIWNYKAANLYYDIVAGSPYVFLSELENDIPITHQDPADQKQQEDEIHSVAVGELPGTRESFMQAYDIQRPRSLAIKYFLAADSFIEGDDTLSAEINSKIGDLYTWLNKNDKASPHYKVAIDLLPTDAGLRQKYIYSTASTYQFKNAMEQLDTLYNRNEINYDLLLLLAKYNIHSSRFNVADTLLMKATATYPYEMPEIIELNGRSRLLSRQHERAIVLYKKLLLLKPRDPLIIYTIARSYALAGNKNEAVKWFSSAVKSGFNYSWVVKFDPAWKDYRSTSSWRSAEASIKKIEYPDDPLSK